MNILHWMKKEDSGLVRTALELANWEERLGHNVAVREPSSDECMYGNMNGQVDIHAIHSQLHPAAYHDGKPKLMYMHGEPLSSVGNRVSMASIVDLATLCEAFICMRQDELAIWQTIKKTYCIPKGVDLEQYRPIELPEGEEKLSGSPAVLYCENWRGERNPLYLLIAMRLVHQKLPNARLHLYNCADSKMADIFKKLNSHCHLWPFLRSLCGPVKDVNLLYNRADIVVSCLSPLYARGIEAFAAGKAFICPGYREHNYPWTCEMSPESIADAIVRCWESYDSVNYRQWAEKYHSAEASTRQACAIYEKYL